MMPDSFKEYHKQIKAINSVKVAVSGVSNGWWLKTSINLRGYLLANAGVVDVYRFVDTPWRSLPDGLRDAIVLNTKALNRELSGCGWL